MGANPVQLSLVTSLNRPGGNITGVYILNAEIMGKRLELLHESVPAVRVIGYLANPKSQVWSRPALLVANPGFAPRSASIASEVAGQVTAIGCPGSKWP